MKNPLFSKVFTIHIQFQLNMGCQQNTPSVPRKTYTESHEITMKSYEITIQSLQIGSSNMGFGIYSGIIFYPSHHHFI